MLHKCRLPQQIAAIQHAVADLVAIQLVGEPSAAERCV